MAENENAVVETEEVAVEDATVVEEVKSTPEQPKKEGFGAKLKEWFRKQCVNLKRKPQRIAFLFFVISTVLYLIGLNVVSPGPVVDFESQPYLGLSVFIVTLLSVLVLVLFLNTFPKHGIAYKKGGKKHKMNYIMLALTFIFVGIMIAFDIIYYKQLLGCIDGNEPLFFKTKAQANQYSAYWDPDFFDPAYDLDVTSYKPYLLKAFSVTIAHVVFLCISAILLATLPLYRKLIMKIDTSKVVESTEIKEAIDTEDE